jgi:hypothetical protein
VIEDHGHVEWFEDDNDRGELRRSQGVAAWETYCDRRNARLDAWCSPEESPYDPKRAA